MLFGTLLIHDCHHSQYVKVPPLGNSWCIMQRAMSLSAVGNEMPFGHLLLNAPRTNQVSTDAQQIEVSPGDRSQSSIGLAAFPLYLCGLEGSASSFNIAHPCNVGQQQHQLWGHSMLLGSLTACMPHCLAKPVKQTEMTFELTSQPCWLSGASDLVCKHCKSSNPFQFTVDPTFLS